MGKILVTRPIIPDINKYFSLLSNVFNTRYLSNNGPYLQELEDKLIALLNVGNGAVFCNGTTALMIALKSMNLTGKVITTPFTFPATANALIWNNLTPIFCDVDYETMNILPETVSEHIDEDVMAVLPVHVFGTPCDVDGFNDLSETYGLKIIYDAAHAFGTKINGIDIGNFGDITMFSFHPTKLFHTGEGGMLVYSNSKYDSKIKRLRNFGIKDDTTGSILPGINGKMNEINAALGLCILDKIDEERNKRILIHEYYMNYLSHVSWIKILPIKENIRHSYQYFPIRIEKHRDRVYDNLIKNNIFARKYFYPLCSDFKHFKYAKAQVPNAVKISKEILCLPFHGELIEEDVQRICRIIIQGGIK